MGGSNIKTINSDNNTPASSDNNTQLTSLDPVQGQRLPICSPTRTWSPSPSGQCGPMVLELPIRLTYTCMVALGEHQGLWR